jgi:hypothetical protein
VLVWWYTSGWLIQPWWWTRNYFNFCVSDQCIHIDNTKDCTTLYKQYNNVLRPIFIKCISFFLFRPTTQTMRQWVLLLIYI